jgi:PAS domain S-box-containing protein
MDSGGQIGPFDILFNRGQKTNTKTTIAIVLAGIATICLLSGGGLFGSSPLVPSLAWLLAPAFATLAVVQFVCPAANPQRARVYILICCFLFAAMCAGLVGFPKAAYLGWVILGSLANIICGRLLAAGVAAIMEGSILVWILLQPSIKTSVALGAIGSGLVAIGLIAVVSIIWYRLIRSLNELNVSQSKQSFEHEQLSSLINSMADGVIAVDSNVNVILYNAAALNVLDSNTSMRGQRLADFLHPISQTGKSVDITKMVSQTKLPSTNRDLKIVYQDGSVVNLYLSIAPVHLGYLQRGTQGFVIMIRDITREKSLEDERNEFISVVSHELRTPIAIAEGNISNAQFVLKNARTKNRTELIVKSIDEAHEQVLFLAGMINDLSTLSRAERDKLDFEVTAINPIELLSELFDSYREAANMKGLTLRLKHPAKLPDLYSSDLYVKEIIQNFITNALKYTDKGQIIIGARATQDGIEFSVADSGIGISKPDQTRIFDKFFRSEDYRTRKTGGTGLGLYITMKLSRLLKAELSVTSKLDQGSIFTIKFPNLQSSKN